MLLKRKYENLRKYIHLCLVQLFIKKEKVHYYNAYFLDIRSYNLDLYYDDKAVTMINEFYTILDDETIINTKTLIDYDIAVFCESLDYINSLDK